MTEDDKQRHAEHKLTRGDDEMMESLAKSFLRVRPEEPHISTVATFAISAISFFRATGLEKTAHVFEAFYVEHLRRRYGE
jgi:hypothetical protein